MSSIDKYVIDEARNCDSRVRVTKSLGRIIGKIDGRVVFNIKDRWGVLDASERNEIHYQITQYQQRERQEQINQAEEERRRLEEERRRLEEEKRRLEQERQRVLAVVENKVDSKLKVIEANLQNLKSLYNDKKSSLTSFEEDLNEIKRILPTSNLQPLQLKRDNLLTNLDNNYDLANNELLKVKREIEALKRQYNSGSSIENLTNIETLIDRIQIITKTYDLSTEIGLLDSDLLEAKQNASNLANIVHEAEIITDDFVKEQIKAEISNINLLDSQSITQTLDSITNRIETYKFNIGREEVVSQIDDLNKLEASIKGIKKLIEYNVTDTYVLTNISEENRAKATEILEKLQQLLEIEYKVSDLNLTEIHTQLYKKMINPQNSDDEIKWLKDLSNYIDVALDKASIFKNQYEQFITLKEELSKYGIIDNQEFNCDNCLEQIKSLELRIIEEMELQEQGRLHSTYIDIISTMQETEYEIFHTEADQYSIEVYFINKKYPGVLTRFIIDNNGNFRRSLVGLKIDNHATELDNLIKLSAEMEDDVVEFLDIFEQQTGRKLTPTEGVLYDSENAVSKLQENGYFELDEDGKAAYKEYMGIEEIQNIVNEETNTSSNRKFGIWNQDVHKIKDTRVERDRIRNASASYQRRVNFQHR